MAGALIALWSVVAVVLVLFDLVLPGAIVGVFALCLLVMAALARA